MDILSVPQATAPLGTWLSYIERLHAKDIDLDLTRMRLIASKLGLLKPAPFIFTVAGTNGKGTTCRMLETLLIKSGYRVGVYSSPHLVQYTERVRIQGIELKESLHSDSFSFIEAARDGILLTYFEFGTLSALNLFCKANLDIVILEVGLGGRLDATNIIDSNLAIITSIALDHTDWLGVDRESIGWEKAGIFRAGKIAVIGETEMPHTITDVAVEKGTILQRINYDWYWQQTGNSWMLQDIYGKLCYLPLPKIPLPNAATALVALRMSGLKVNEGIIRRYLSLITLPGRFQTISKFPRVIFDVAHNPHASCYLASCLANEQITGQVHAVIGMLCDKDIIGTLTELSSQVDRWYCASLDCPRGATAEELMIVNLNNSKPFINIESAWQAACLNANNEDVILVCGSFYTVAQVMKLIAAENNHGK